MKAFVIAATALLLGVPVAAQQHGHAARHQGHAEGATMMAHCMEKMGGPQPAMLLAHRAELELTGEQVQQLEALQQQMKAQMLEQHGQHAQGAEHGQHAQHAQEGRHAQHGSMQMDPEARARMQAAHAAFAAQAAALLTDAQRTRLGQLVEEGMKHEHGAAGGHGEGGAHGGMEHCPMMKKGGGAHGAAGGGHDR